MSNSTYARKLRRRAWIKQGFRCYWCLEICFEYADQNDPRKLTAEHLKRKADGGKYHEDNIVAACNDCNWKRGELDKKLVFLRNRRYTKRISKRKRKYE